MLAHLVHHSSHPNVYVGVLLVTFVALEVTACVRKRVSVAVARAAIGTRVSHDTPLPRLKARK